MFVELESNWERIIVKVERYDYGSYVYVVDYIQWIKCSKFTLWICVCVAIYNLNTISLLYAQVKNTHLNAYNEWPCRNITNN